MSLGSKVSFYFTDVQTTAHGPSAAHTLFDNLITVEER